MSIKAFDRSNHSDHLMISTAPPRGFCEAVPGKVFAFIIIPMVIAFVLGAVQSLGWRERSEPVFFAYLAWLIDRWDFVPYVDFFDFNLPGTYVIHYLIGRVFGYDSLSLRIADLIYLSGLLTITALLMRGFGRRISMFAAAAFGLYYISQFTLGGFALQRDYFLLLPISIAIWLLWSRNNIGNTCTSFLVGLLFGACATVRLQSVIALPFLIIFQWAEVNAPDEDWILQGSTIRKLLFLMTWTGLGFLVPIAGMLSVLWIKGALWAFLEAAINYWPLYSKLSGNSSTGLHILSALQRLQYAFKAYFNFGGAALLLVSAVLGSFIALSVSELDRSRKRKVMLLISMLISFNVYPVITGIDCSYRWIPFEYFAVLLGSLCLLPQPKASKPFHSIFPAVILCIVLLPPISATLYRVWQYGVTGSRFPDASEGRDEQIASYLRTHVGPQDTVQALDWMENVAIPAMLTTKTKTATPFVYDLMFYHDVSRPYIKKLRDEFMQRIKASRPRFIIKTSTVPMRGPDTTQDFPELTAFLKAEYLAALVGSGFTIYERVDSR